MSFQTELGLRIKNLRQKLGFTQNDLANALHVSPQAVSKWERGENAPDIALLPSLATVLNTSIDSLVGYSYQVQKSISGTVFFSDVQYFAKRAESMTPYDIATLINAHFYKVTESVLQYRGIPIKYIGDAFLCVFLGDNTQERAIRASLKAKAISSESFSIGLNTDPVYMGAIGHPDYARPDIMGDTVNLAARITSWAGKDTESGIAATEFAVSGLQNRLNIGNIIDFDVKGKTSTVKLYEIKGIRGSNEN